MNVKTMLKSRLIRFSVILILLVMFMGIAVWLWKKYTNEFDCATDVDIHIKHADSNTELTAAINLYLHFILGKNSYISEYGTISIDDNKYILDRSARLNFSKEPHNGYYEITRGEPEKNPRDNVPDKVYGLLTSNQKTLFFKVSEIRDDFWQVMDLRRTLIICKKINTPG